MFQRFLFAFTLLIVHLCADDSFVSDEPNLFWFAQISDTHFSYFSAFERITDLKMMCTDVLPIINPDILLLTGDITDGRRENSYDSGQNLKEWKAYWSIFEETKIQNKVKWLDIRGNHDVFGVLNAESKDNYFSIYSVQGQTYPYSYLYSHVKPYGKYSFIGMDLTPTPGNKWPLNFFGNVISKVAKSLILIDSKAKDSNMTFWFGHYPTSSVISPNFDIKRLIGQNGFAYFSGHLHQLFSRTRMYARQNEDYLELELADWKDNRAFRIVAVDNNMMNFQDFRLGVGLKSLWPLGIITNPKNSDLLLPNKESIDNIIKSKTIRILAWSDTGIETVQVYINDNLIGEAKQMSVKHKNLYELPWNPMDYQGGYYKLFVSIKDKSNRILKLHHHFTIEANPSSFGFDRISHMILCFNIENFFQIFIYTIWVVQFVTMIFMRYITKRNPEQKKCVGRNWLSRGVWRFVNNNYVFYGKLLELFVIITCPIYVGYFLDDYLGVFFHFGLYLNHTFLPIGFGAVDEFFFFLIYRLPVLFIIFRELSKRTMYDKIKTSISSTPQETEENVVIKSSRKCLHFLFNTRGLYLAIASLLIVRIVLYQVIPYGVISMLLSPARVGVLIFDVTLLFFYIPKIQEIVIVNGRKD